MPDITIWYLAWWLMYTIPACGGCHSQDEVDHWYQTSAENDLRGGKDFCSIHTDLPVCQ